jgi:hypothetical protein
LIALEAVMDFAFEVDKAVDSKLFAHFKAGWTFGAEVFFRVDHLVFVDEFNVTVTGCCIVEEASAD